MKSTRSIFPKIKNQTFLETIQCVSGGTEKVVYASESSFQLIKSAKSSGGDHTLWHKKDKVPLRTFGRFDQLKRAL